MSTWTLILSAFGLALFLEGLPYFVSPGAVRRYLELLSRTGDGTMRTLGLALMASGLALAWTALHWR